VINKTTKPQFTIPIREGVLTFVEEIFKSKNAIVYNNKKLKKELIIYLIFYIVDLTEEEGYGIYLNTKILKKNFLNDYKPYLSFLEDNDLIILAGNYVVGKRPNFYGLDNKYYDFKKTIIKHKITDTVLLKKLNYDDTRLSEYHRNRNNYCIKTRKHLVKYFDDNLEMDIEGATKEISSLHSSKQFDANYRSINEYETKLWKYSIKKETDNRLHTVICRTNKKLLKYITYNKQKMGEIDFKTSQPLFLYIILKSIFENSMDNKVGEFLKKKLGTELLKKIRNKGIDKEELNNFGDIILNKDLYNYIGERIKTKGSVNEGFYYVDKSNKTWKDIYFDTKRELMKNVIMRSLYKGRGDEVEEVKGLFASIFEIVKIINSHKKLSASDSNLANVLQNIEAYIVLDLIAKDVSKKFKNIPLFSIHDSLITYNTSIDEVKKHIQERFTLYTKINGENVLKSGSW
tara:strand:+ start:91 stop:1467 length:1377 start_codon:yes stop_codon:yes gene_type:complete